MSIGGRRRMMWVIWASWCCVVEMSVEGEKAFGILEVLGSQARCGHAAPSVLPLISSIALISFSFVGNKPNTVSVGGSSPPKGPKGSPATCIMAAWHRSLRISPDQPV